MICAGLITVVAVGDQWLKYKVEKQDPDSFPRPFPGTKDKIWVYRNHNGGFPFGFMEKHRELVRLIPMTLTSVLIGSLMEMMRTKGRRMEKICMSLTIGGSLSNLYDRYVRGYVVDYFSLRFGFLKEVVFNLGDICIFLGSGLLLFCPYCAGKGVCPASAEISIDKKQEVV
ncbi:MAG: signal peptidase II [Lachnospiraceae bacterium]|nr:signal peptidase II [Lachnospiraceae bacterium]